MNTPPFDAIRVPPDQLRALSVCLFIEAGVPRSDADLISDLLIDTDLCGTLSHGTLQIKGYIRSFLDGSLNKAPQVEVVRDDPTTAIVDGDGGLGHIPATRATELAIAKAGEAGVGAVASRNHGHYGGAGKYTRMIMRRGFIGFSISGHTMQGMRADRPQWNPLGNPPMSFAFPADKESPMLLDMGTSFFEPEHFPHLFEQAPAAFFKSIGLVAVSNLLGGALTGMMLPEFQPEKRLYSAAGYGAFTCALNIGRFVPVEAFTAEVDRTMREVHELPPLPGLERYDLPGGQEQDRQRTWAIEGIPLGPEHQRSLEEIADELGVSVPWR